MRDTMISQEEALQCGVRHLGLLSPQWKRQRAELQQGFLQLGQCLHGIQLQAHLQVVQQVRKKGGLVPAAALPHLGC